MKILRSVLFTGLLSFAHSSVHAQSVSERFQYFVDTTFAAHPTAVGIMASVVTADNKVWTYATGVSDKKTNAKLDPAQPVVTASNTKTYIAATILKLQQQKKLHYDDAIEKHLPDSTVKKLQADGYDTKRIGISHLLSHTSGIDDYVNDDYFTFIGTNKQYKWTRGEQIERAMQVGNPLAAPGDTFKYADVNYLLLTEIIEQETGEPFYKSVRKLLNYKTLGLNATWFTTLEPAPKHILPTIHQYWTSRQWDALDFHPSWDLYGGGGIVATPAEMALFFKYLFEGKMVKDMDLLTYMTDPVKGKAKTNYGFGIRKINIAGHTGYYHGGFWGTDVVYFPDLKAAISIVILEREGREPLSAGICKAIVQLLEKQASNK